MIALIAPPASIPSLQEQPLLRGSQAFADSDTGAALDAMRVQRPSLIAIERTFAASPRGQAFLKRVKSDPSLAGCEIQWVGIRRTPRFRLPEAAQVTIDGETATLLDISSTGAHVVSRETLRPKQRIRLALREGSQPVPAHVVWAQLELPADGPYYRAGIEFASAPSSTIAEFMASLGISRTEGEGVPTGN